MDTLLYSQKGYILLKRLLDAAETAALQGECVRLWRDADRSESNLRTVARGTLEGGRAVDRLDPVSDLSPPLAQLARGERMRGVASALLGEPALLMKDKLIYKAGGVQGYALHQDFHVWQELPAPPEALVSIGLAIDPAGADNGAVQFYPGLHHRLHTDPGAPTDLFAPSSGVVPRHCVGGVAPELIPLEPGDAVVFGSLVPHESDPNWTGAPRRMLYLTYNAARYGDLYDLYYSRFRAYQRRDREAAGDDETYYR
jgi:ectoine hydroxylase-related dioxygenase (phytanoyl-CoA dioxygenase family)